MKFNVDDVSQNGFLTVSQIFPRTKNRLFLLSLSLSFQIEMCEPDVWHHFIGLDLCYVNSFYSCYATASRFVFKFHQIEEDAHAIEQQTNKHKKQLTKKKERSEIKNIHFVCFHFLFILSLESLALVYSNINKLCASEIRIECKKERKRKENERKHIAMKTIIMRIVRSIGTDWSVAKTWSVSDLIAWIKICTHQHRIIV